MKTKRIILIGLSAGAAALIVLLLFAPHSPVISLAQSDFPPKKTTPTPSPPRNDTTPASRPPRKKPMTKPRPPRDNPTSRPGPEAPPTSRSALSDLFGFGEYVKNRKARSISRSAPLVSMSFTTARVDRYGNVTKIPDQTVSGFVEDLGNGVKLEMVKVPGGVFDMGLPSDESQREDNEVLRRGVRVNGFFIGRFEVTQAQWRAVMGDNLNPYFKGANLPIEKVSWEDAIEFCRRLSRRTGREYRLPTEAEWEYAARAGARTPFAFGETITPEIVNYNGNIPYGNAPKGEYRQRTIPVGSLGVANAFGLFDMHGNVWEWCEDWYGPYDPNQLDNPKGPVSGSTRVLRGGSWATFGGGCRSANRLYLAPSTRVFDLGFRVVCVSARTM
ncbi:MAG: SUMF1/EgtB/PvdO family nonheme iron enzyme [Blastocatellia bacterium]